MNDDTRFLIRRMDTLEKRLSDKIDGLEAFKNKLYGIALVCGALGSRLVDLIIKHI